MKKVLNSNTDKKLLSLLLAASTCVLTLSGCGKGDSSTSTTTNSNTSQNAYIAEYLTDDLSQITDPNSSGQESLSSFKVYDNDLYYIRNYYEYPEEEITEATSLEVSEVTESNEDSDAETDSIEEVTEDTTETTDDSSTEESVESADEEVAESVDDTDSADTGYDIDEYYVMKYDSETNTQEEIINITDLYKDASNANTSIYTSGLEITSTGEIVILCSITDYSSDNYSENYKLLKYNSNGELVAEHSVSDDIESTEAYLTRICITSDDLIAVSSYNEVYVYDSDLSYKGSSGAIEEGLDNIFARNNELYFLQYADSGMQIIGLDTKTFELTEPYENVPSSISQVSSSKSGTIYFSDGTSLYSYDIDSQSKTKLADWLDADINGNYISSFSVDENENVYVVLEDYDNNTKPYLCLKSVDPSVVANRVNITIGTIFGGYDLTDAVLNFNKTHPEYHIKMIKYMNEDSDDYSEAIQAAALALVNDINSGSLDLISINSLDNVASLNSKGAFEDLNTFISTSEYITADDLQTSIANGFTYDGKLIALPRSFTITTLVGNSDIVGTEMGMTYDKFFNIVNSNSDVEAFTYNTKSSALYTLIGQSMDSFINWETGDCTFNSDSFIRFLEYANSLPEDTSYDSDKSIPARTMDGELLFTEAYISNIYDIQEYTSYYPNDKGTIVGFPTDDGIGTYLQTSNAVAISSKSNNKDIAWKFMEYYVSNEYEPEYDYPYYFPILKSQLDKQTKKLQEVKYVTNTDGSYVLDENGEKMISNARGSLDYGDWSVTFHFPTDEDAQLLQQLIDTGKVSQDYNNDILNIITEESEPYFQGQKTVNEVADIIQSRVNIYVHENM